MNRREYLGLLGSSAATAALAGCSALRQEDAETPPSTTHRSPQATITARFERTLDAVDDLGMDPTGQQSIDDALAQTFDVTESTLVEFPPGEYRFERTHLVDELRNWGMLGTGADRSDVRIRPPTGEGRHFLVVDSGENVLIENLTFDMLDTKPEWINNVFQLRDGLRVVNVEYDGFHPSERTEYRKVDLPQRSLLRARATDPDGTHIVDGFVKKGPTDYQPYPIGHTAIAYGGGANHKGTLVIRNSHVENMNQHGTYCSRADGVTQIENTTFKNCNGVSIRLAGEGSWAKNCTVRIDVDDQHPDNRRSLTSIAGIVADGGGGPDFTGKAGLLIENCEIDFAAAGGASADAIWIDGSHGAATLRGTTVRNRVAGASTLRAGTPGVDSWYRLDGRTPDRPWKLRLDNVTVDVAAPSRHGGIELSGRPGSTIADTDVRLRHSQPAVSVTDSVNTVLDSTTVQSDSGPGYLIRDSAGAVFDGGSIVAQGVPLVISAAEPGDDCLLRTPSVPELTWRVAEQLDVEDRWVRAVGTANCHTLSALLEQLGELNVVGVEESVIQLMIPPSIDLSATVGTG